MKTKHTSEDIERSIYLAIANAYLDGFAAGSERPNVGNGWAEDYAGEYANGNMPEQSPLIAAAPDLLAALESILFAGKDDMIEHNPDEGSFCFLCGGEWCFYKGADHAKDCPIHAARAAIAKAGGGA